MRIEPGTSALVTGASRGIGRAVCAELASRGVRLGLMSRGREDLEAAGAVGRFFVVANGPERDAALRQALAAFPNATVTQGAMGDGFYEAVVSTLAERR